MAVSVVLTDGNYVLHGQEKDIIELKGSSEGWVLSQFEKIADYLLMLPNCQDAYHHIAEYIKKYYSVNERLNFYCFAALRIDGAYQISAIDFEQMMYTGVILCRHKELLKSTVQPEHWGGYITTNPPVACEGVNLLSYLDIVYNLYFHSEVWRATTKQLREVVHNSIRTLIPAYQFAIIRSLYRREKALKAYIRLQEEKDHKEARDFLAQTKPKPQPVTKHFGSDYWDLEIKKLEVRIPYYLKVAELDEMALRVENASRVNNEMKMKFLTRLDKLYIARKVARGLNGASKQYCHKFRVKHHLVGEETKGYGSLCVGHSRKAYY